MRTPYPYRPKSDTPVRTGIDVTKCVSVIINAVGCLYKPERKR